MSVFLLCISIINLYFCIKIGFYYGLDIIVGSGNFGNRLAFRF